MIYFYLEIYFLLSTVCNTSSSRDTCESEKGISDDELKKLILTFCSSDILNGLNDANYKTRLSKVQELSQVCIDFH